MNEAIDKALDKLEKGKWDAQKALSAIEAGWKKAAKKRASWLKVKVIEEGKKRFSFRLPLGAMSLVLAAANPLVKWGLSYVAKKHGELHLPVDKLNLRQIVTVLRSYGPMTVADVKDGDTEILIVLT
jgi:hypothetical protein